MNFPWSWPFNGNPIQLEPPPSHQEHIYLDQNPGWYQDDRKDGYHPPAPVFQAGQGMAFPYWYGQGTAQTPWFNSQFGWPYGSGTFPNFGPSTSYGYDANGKYDHYKLYNDIAIAETLSKQYKNGYLPYPWTGMMGMGGMMGGGMMPGMVPGVGGYSWPPPGDPMSMAYQAQYAAAMNARLGAMPNSPPYWVGGATDWASQQAIIGGQMGHGRGPTTQFAPYKPGDGQQFWCKELDGSWTLRTHADIVGGEVSPGKWERHNTSGYFFWVKST